MCVLMELIKSGNVVDSGPRKLGHLIGGACVFGHLVWIFLVIFVVWWRCRGAFVIILAEWDRSLMFRD